MGKKTYSFINQRGESELEKFACFFGQDSNVLFSSFYEGAKDYFDSISNESRSILRKELQELVENETSNSALKKAWFRLGAEVWQSDLNISEAMRDFIWMLEQY
ncbi:MAG: contact-dependent growth inhibition system immunity protein [Pseudomonadales bacterium]|nr:contact-dependent growth inhibition system immunity protein [Pseudomonadales bacterium]